VEIRRVGIVPRKNRTFAILLEGYEMDMRTGGSGERGGRDVNRKFRITQEKKKKNDFPRSKIRKGR